MRNPPAPEWVRWLDANGHDLGVLTGQDYRALGAIDACWQLARESEANAVAAVRALLPLLQPSCLPFARELIARWMDWSDRERLWPKVIAHVARATNIRELIAAHYELGGAPLTCIYCECVVTVSDSTSIEPPVCSAKACVAMHEHVLQLQAEVAAEGAEP